MAPLAASPVVFGLALLWSPARLHLGVDGTWIVIVIAHSVLAIPFVIRAVRPALAQFDSRLYEAARSLGANRTQVTVDVVIPLIKASLLAGAGFAFAISIAEMSATIMLVQPDLLTMPVSVYHLFSGRQTGAASAMSVVMIVILIISFIVIDRWAGKSSLFRRGL